MSLSLSSVSSGVVQLVSRTVSILRGTVEKWTLNDVGNVLVVELKTQRSRTHHCCRVFTKMCFLTLVHPLEYPWSSQSFPSDRTAGVSWEDLRCHEWIEVVDVHSWVSGYPESVGSAEYIFPVQHVHWSSGLPQILSSGLKWRWQTPNFEKASMTLPFSLHFWPFPTRHRTELLFQGFFVGSECKFWSRATLWGSKVTGWTLSFPTLNVPCENSTLLFILEYATSWLELFNKATEPLHCQPLCA